MPTGASMRRTSASRTSCGRTGQRRDALAASPASPRTRATFTTASSSAFLGEEAPEPVEEDDEEHDRLLARHRHARDLLVGERARAPRRAVARRRRSRRPASAAARAAGRAVRRTRTPRTRTRRARPRRGGAARPARAATTSAGRSRSSTRARRGSARPDVAVPRRRRTARARRSSRRARSGAQPRGSVRTRHARQRASAAAIEAETPSTAKSGAHSARITFCSRCAVSR